MRAEGRPPEPKFGLNVPPFLQKKDQEAPAKPLDEKDPKEGDIE